MLRVRIPAHDLHVTTDALSGRIARVILCGRSVYLLQLSIINIGPESAFDRFEIRLVTAKKS